MVVCLYGSVLYMGCTWVVYGLYICKYTHQHRFAEQPRGTSMQPTETNNAEQLNEMLQEPGSVYIREFVRELDFRKYVCGCGCIV